MKKLPLGQPPISAYLFHAYPLSILAQEDRYLPWFYSTYIQLFSFPDEELKFYTHPCCTHHQIRHLYVQTCPLLEARAIDRKTLAPTPTGLGAWIRDAIEHKCYVQVDVDFFYLPNRPQHQRRHFIHEILVSGYDPVAQTFLCSGFDQRGQYTTAALPCAILEKALAWTKERHIQQALDSGERLPPWFAAAMEDRPSIFLYKYLRDQSCLLDLASIGEHLEDYLQERDSSTRQRALAKPRSGGAWGLGTYTALQQHLEECKNGSTSFSPIIWRILAEHKTCMKNRLAFLIQRDLIDPHRTPTRRYHALANRVHSLRLALLRNRHTARPDTFSATIHTLTAIASEERKLLTMVHNLL